CELPRAAGAARVSAEGRAAGRVRYAAGAYTRAARARQGAMRGRVGPSLRWRLAMRGAVAEPPTVTRTSARGRASPPASWGAVRAARAAVAGPRAAGRRRPGG